MSPDKWAAGLDDPKARLDATEKSQILTYRGLNSDLNSCSQSLHEMRYTVGGVFCKPLHIDTDEIRSSYGLLSYFLTFIHVDGSNKLPRNFG
jgi:hypothetical protein